MGCRLSWNRRCGQARQTSTIALSRMWSRPSCTFSLQIAPRMWHWEPLARRSTEWFPSSVKTSLISLLKNLSYTFPPMLPGGTRKERLRRKFRRIIECSSISGRWGHQGAGSVEWKSVSGDPGSPTSETQGPAKRKVSDDASARGTIGSEGERKLATVLVGSDRHFLTLCADGVWRVLEMT